MHGDHQTLHNISNLSNIMYELLSHIEVHMLKKTSILHDYVKKHKQRTLKYIQVHNFKLMGPCFSWKVLFITVVPWFLDNLQRW